MSIFEAVQAIYWLVSAVSLVAGIVVGFAFGYILARDLS